MTVEVDRIDRALDALGPVNGARPPVHATEVGADVEPTIRALVLAAMEDVARQWTPGEMAAHLQERGEIKNASDAIKGIRTAFWSLRKEQLAESRGTGRGTRTFAAKWAPGFAEGVGA